VAARWSTRRAAPCSTSGKRSAATQRTASPSVIHGKIRHEETLATASQALKPPSGPYLVVLDRDEAAGVCRYIREGGDRGAFLARYAEPPRRGSTRTGTLVRVGLANQTTMLMTESLEVGEMFRQALEDRYGAGALQSTTGRSTRFAARPRIGRTPWWHC